MSFAFGFSGDDIDGGPDVDASAEHFQPSAVSDEGDAIIAPRVHSLEELLASLPSQVSYNYLTVPPNPVNPRHDGKDGQERKPTRVPRRSLFDIRQQLMAEADPVANANDSLLSGLEQGDLTSGIYEGGFKTWECAVDLASLMETVDTNTSGSLYVIELGAGSAIPSLTLLQKVLKSRLEHKNEKRTEPAIKFTLCDYNEDVLRLGTAVNVFLTTILSQRRDGDEGAVENMSDSAEDEDLENIDEDMIKDCMKTLADIDVSIELISGGWGRDFLDLFRAKSRDETILVLATETIYSPKATAVFSEVLIDLLRCGKTESNAWVAAKKVYFGVGGGVQDFCDQISRFGGSVKPIVDSQEFGVGRVLLQVTAR